MTFLVVVLLCVVIWCGVRHILREAEAKRKQIQRNLKRLKKRIQKQDSFTMAHHYSYDLCIVFNIVASDDRPSEYQRKHSARKVVTRLCEAGLQTSMFFSVQQDEVYCKVRASPSRLQTEADRIDHKMPLEPGILKAICDRGRSDTEGWGPIRFPKQNFMDELAAFRGHFAAYDKERAVADDIPFTTFEEGVRHKQTPTLPPTIHLTPGACHFHQGLFAMWIASSSS